MDIFVGTVLIDNQERIFLIKERDKNRIGKDRLNLPGGSVDGNESLEEAAIRETKEETGMDVKLNSLLGLYKCHKNEAAWIYIVFEAKLTKKTGKPVDIEVKRGKWFTKDEFIHLDATEIVHPDMQLVYNIATEKKGLLLDSIKTINYDIQ